MSTEAETTTPSNEDEYHLDLLGILHWVLGGLAALAGFFPILHILFGIFALGAGIIGRPPEPEARAMTVLMGTLFLLTGGLIMITSWAIAICLYLSGSYLRAHQHHTFCLVIAVIICFSFPLGTALGVFTILVLIRPSVRELFQ